MTNFLYQLGRSSARHPWRVLGIWLVAAITIIGGSATFGRDLEDTFSAPGLDSQKALELLETTNSAQAGVTAQAVLTPTDSDTTFFSSPQAASELTSVQDTLAGLPNVVAVSPTAEILGTSADQAVASGVVSPDGRVAKILVQYQVLESLSVDDLEHLKAVQTNHPTGSPLQLELGGELFFSFEQPSGASELIGIAAAIVILVIAFGSVVAMGLPIAVALFGLAIGGSSMGLITYLIEIPGWTPDLATMIGLGVGIDYALFLVTRHREFLAQNFPVVEAAGRATATAGKAVVFAGGTVVIAILGLAVAGIPFVTAAGVAISVIVALMVTASITLVPALLGMAGPWINRLHVGRRKKNKAIAAAPSPRWHRWGAHVSNHAWPYAIGVTVGLLALSAPVLSIQLGFPDEGSLPQSRTERRAYDLVSSGFGPGANGPLLIAVNIAGVPDSDSPVPALASAIAADPGIASVSPAVVDTDSGVATLVAIPTTSPQDHATTVTIERIRADIIPDIVADSSASAHIGGLTASFTDIAERVTQRLPWFIAAVIVLSFLLLTVMFQSILVPLKAAILNLLSIGAGYGVMVMVFQWGWGKDLIGLESTIPIISFIPLFMFAILFGLSMDYEVFLLSRIREEHLAGADNTTSVIHGIAGTARVITSAALIMIAVFSGFVLGSDPTVKMFGLGLATAIFVDATVVRIVLVPATMKLMGDANWWLPNWLSTILPAVDLEGSDLKAGDIGPVVDLESGPINEPLVKA